MTKTQNLFSGRSDKYISGRPSYAPELIEALYNLVGFSQNSIIADIGAGTGKFSKLLLEKGTSVICVEPNKEMLNAATEELKQYKTVTFLNTDANNTGIKNHSVDFVTAAQSFHWFDVAAFKKESQRILKKNGKTVLLWNMRDMNSPFNIENSKICTTYCPHFHGFNGGIQENDSRISHYFNHKYQVLSFNNPLSFDKNKFINRMLSTSYSLTPTDISFNEYINELTDLFDRYAINNKLIMPNKSVAYWG